MSQGYICGVQPGADYGCGRPIVSALKIITGDRICKYIFEFCPFIKKTVEYLMHLQYEF